MEIRYLWNLADIRVRREYRVVFEKRVCAPGKRFGVFLYESFVHDGAYAYNIRWRESISEDDARQFCREITVLLDNDEAWKLHLAIDSFRISGAASIADACCIVIDTNAISNACDNSQATHTKVAVVTCNVIFAAVIFLLVVLVYIL